MLKDDPEQRQLHILVVDDNEDAATMLSVLLELWGYRTSTASDGLAAVNAARRDRYDMVFLDLHMPIMDGFEAAGLLGQLRPAPKLIAYSSDDDIETRKRTANLGFSAHLTKLASLDCLRDTLTFHLQGTGLLPPAASPGR